MGFHDTNGVWRQTETGREDLDINSFYLAAGTPLAAFADGATDVPGLVLDNSEAQGVRWNNHAAPLAVWGDFVAPRDRRPGTDITLHIECSKTGATVGDATTFTVSAFANVVGALRDADADFGGASGAIVGDATSKTVQKVTRTLASADIPAAGTKVSLSIKPTAGLLGTDDITMQRVYITYEKVIGALAS